MLDSIFKIKMFVPTICEKTVYDIDYNKLYANGKRFILFDLDNTLISYDEEKADEKLVSLIQSIINLGFSIIVVSNNRLKRIALFCNELKLPYVYNAMKPLKFGFRKALKILKVKSKDEVITCGDQLMTDILGSSRYNLDSILVKPIKKKTEKWYTRNNRLMEKNVLKRMKKYDNQKYLEIEEKHEY